ncbi:MAG: cation:proton antiporter [Myxococcota bacterium]
MHELHAFTDLALVFTVAVAAALVLARLGLPVVLGYLATGVILGPPVLGWVARGEELNIVAEVGVVLLLFTVGLEFSLSDVRRAWKAVLVAGGLQMAGTIGIVAAIGLALGREVGTAVTWGMLVATSSTAVVLRLLDARGEAKAVHGRVILGVLIFQDLCVVPMMLVLPLLAGESGGVGAIVGVLARAIGIVAVTLVLSQWVVPRAFKAVAKTRNREVFLLAVLGVAGLTAWVTSMTGLSLALGAFVAGMVLADTEYSHQAMAEVLPFRTVTMCVFFVGVGMLLDVDVLTHQPLAVAAATGGIVAVKIGVMWVVGIVLRVPVRIAGLAAVTLAQVGEFAFVLASPAADLGLLSPDEQRAFLAASIVTLALSPMLVALFPRLLAGSRALAPLERWLDVPVEVPEPEDHTEETGHVIVAGLGVCGRTVVSALERVGIEVVIVELNPETVATERGRGRRIVYGDVAAPEVLGHAGLGQAQVVCLVTSDPAASRRAVDAIRRVRADVPIVVRTRFASDEGAERGPGIEVLSEEFSGAASIAGAVLKTCGVTQWPDIVSSLVAAQRAVPADEESELGPPPEALAAQVTVR